MGDRQSRWLGFARRGVSNARVLLEAYEAIAAAVAKQTPITPAAEWLLNNFHIVEEQIRDVRALLPSQFFRKLPRLDGGHLRGMPRIYGIAWAFTAHTDSRFDAELLLRFVRAYQRVQPLALAELWALPIMLRIVMLENLRRLAARIVESMRGRELADRYADELLSIAPGALMERPRWPFAEGTPLPRASAAQLFQRLRYADTLAAPALQQLSERLAREGTHAEEVVQLEVNRQTAADLTVRNLITSMRFISSFEWQKFVEAASLVHDALCAYPLFAAMDFITRDRYRHAVEEIAGRAPATEIEVAQAAVKKAVVARSTRDDRLQDPGYYLIAGGRRALEEDLAFVPRLSRRILRRAVRRALPTYAGVLALVTVGLLAAVLSASAAAGVASGFLVLFGVLAFFPASDIAITLVNRLVTQLVPPFHLPRLELASGVPAPMRTFVVVPTFLDSEAETVEQVRQLETRYLSSGAGELYFALLTDWPDAPSEHLPEDQASYETAAAAVAELNLRHPTAAGGNQRFYLFHRRRLWNAAQGCWMGWERKRGKLHEFNRLLRGARDTSFIQGDRHFAAPPDEVRFVLTLDADTMLPIGAAAELVGTLVHPLNRPRFDTRTQRVVAGYGILQPRITPALPSRSRSTLFQRLFSGRSGVDPYTFQVSDVYQDLFGHGTFTGKGLYEVDTFETALAGRFPDNTVLSHDLFEGSFARCGFVSDVELFEEFPSHTGVAAARSHRWARGDWQLLPWIMGQYARTLPALARWKMLDNLRRTLAAPALFLLLVASCLVPQAPRGLWCAFTLLALALPPLLPLFDGLWPKRNTDRYNWLRNLRADIELTIGRTIIPLALLVHHTWTMVDAIGRTLARLATHRRLLEWSTAAQTEASAQLSLWSFVRGMLTSPAFALLTVAAILTLNPPAIGVALPFAVLWLLAPLVAWRISLPPVRGTAGLIDAHDVAALRLIARRTWRFFDQFVTPSDHCLPPDNYQEEPVPIVAHRSSPTNFGLYLLSVVTARDFGWIGVHDMVKRLEATFAGLERLPRHRGHFLNWIDTGDLRALEPKYVSTVDSGNFAGFLLTLAQACSEALVRPLIGPAALSGIGDELTLLRESLRHADESRGTAGVSFEQLHEALDQLERLLVTSPADGRTWFERCAALEAAAADLHDIVRTLAGEASDSPLLDALAWAASILTNVQSHRRDLRTLAPWLALPPLTRSPDRDSLDSTQWHAVAVSLTGNQKIADLPGSCESAALGLRALREQEGADHAAIDELLDALDRSRLACAGLEKRLDHLAAEARRLFDEMDFHFLFDTARELFSIGYQVNEARLDPGYYDLLASEARLTSFIAIAKRDVPAAHWFRLGRTLVPVDDGAALLSWSGSMFEYLMPSLVMHTPHGSLLDQTCRLIVQRQIGFGRERGVPWGVSESAYHVRDIHLTYQYSNFGVPGLGLKRGLAKDMVVAPYATALAAMYDARSAMVNFERLAAIGALGRFGFYEALDFTVARLPKSKEVAIVRVYMAHHQGMSLIALANALFDSQMRHCFHRIPIVQAAELLLQETAQRDVTVTPPRSDQTPTALASQLVPPLERRLHSPHGPSPSTQLLSNGRYAVMITAAGSGYSSWRDIAVTRWREDTTRDCWGSFLYLRDTASGRLWSAGHQPVCVSPERYEVEFTEDRVRIMRTDEGIESTLEVIVSAEDDAELRRLTLKNTGSRSREIEVTSYAEIVLAPASADQAHPAFSNLFVETEYLPAANGLLATRRRRSDEDKPLWAAQVVAYGGQGGIEFETDRARFLGRGRTVHSPLAVVEGRRLSNTVGAVLDPIFSLRVRLTIAPGASVHAAFATLAAASREGILDLADKYHDAAVFERASTLAWTHAQVQLHYLGIDHSEAHLFQQLASRLIYADASLRAAREILQANRLPVSALWQFGISGDRPIVLVRIASAADRSAIRQLLTAHEYLHAKRLAVDLVILNEQPSSYAEGLQTDLETLVRESRARTGGEAHEPRGDIFVLRADLMSAEARQLLQTAARVLLVTWQGTLSEQLAFPRRDIAPPGHIALSEALRPATKPLHDSAAVATPLAAPQLQFANGLGGFAEDGREYVIVLRRGQRTPLPWINVIANAGFGFQVSESGAGYTWAANSRENQLTAWSNDPVSDPPGEAFYIRDHDSGALWTPTALPIRIEDASYIARFGQGYARFQHLTEDIETELIQFVAREEPVKLSRLRLTNRSKVARRLSVTAYVEWVLGFARAANAPFLITQFDADSGAVFARNPWSAEFGERIAFAAWDIAPDAYTCDRREFLGRNGRYVAPLALATDAALSGRSGAGLDPCAALQRHIALAPEAQVDVCFVLGQSADIDSARALVARFRTPADADLEWHRVTLTWRGMLDCVQVETPDAAMNVMLNHWLLYQTTVCRMFARAAFYQAGGAYGFRDQLQDAMALTTARPDLAREQIVRACSRQFAEGDVQHWWHPPTGRGVRTHFSDDRLWLPYSLAHYLETTHDQEILDEVVPFIDGLPLPPAMESMYFQPGVSTDQATVYEHCARALEVSMRVGQHGLPLMDGGDWNDGMNRVGVGGKGESVWLGWFLCAVLKGFAPIALQRGEGERAQAWMSFAARLKAAIEREAWDGAWYRRAYFDDGTPLGSAGNAECRIDSLPQTWALLSGAGDPVRARRAMESVYEHLVKPADEMVLLFAPPFDKAPLEPGYIKGYLPGVRENGAQYTHAAAWCVIAHALQGDGERAAELFAMLNPIGHGATRAAIHRYKAEPYVVAADVYSEPPHAGRGGWSWYTGAAGWMYRAGVEFILGFKLRGAVATINPCIPPDWPRFAIRYRYRSATYQFSVENPRGVSRGVVRITVDERELAERAVPLSDDGRLHAVYVTLGPDRELPENEVAELSDELR